jgi:hypothetical protein
MANANENEHPGEDQGNAIENETREAASPVGGSPKGEFDDEGRLIPSGSEPGVTEEESKLAEEHADGGSPVGKKF